MTAAFFNTFAQKYISMFSMYINVYVYISVAVVSSCTILCSHGSYWVGMGKYSYVNLVLSELS